MNLQDQLGNQIKEALWEDMGRNDKTIENLNKNIIKQAGKKRIAVIFGGCSPEYSVSLQSAASVIKNINDAEYEMILIGITRKGEWLLYPGGVDHILNDTWAKDNCVPVTILPDGTMQSLLKYTDDESEKIHIDAAFPILHGKNGEDGTVQGLLALAGIPVIGCGMLASAVCMDKDMAHRLVREGGIRTPRGFVFRKGKVQDAFLRADELGYPLFVKPIGAGSSFGISKVLNAQMLPKAIEDAFRYDDRIMIEEGIKGFEVGCAIMGESTLMIGAVDEIELLGGVFDYEEKYTLKTSQIHVPARISVEMSEKIKETAQKIYRILGCSVLARVDMFLTSDGEILFNEVNTIPGFTEHSRFPNMMKYAGISMKEIVNNAIRQVIAE